jgi:hypothetical protein
MLKMNSIKEKDMSSHDIINITRIIGYPNLQE